MDVKPGDVVMLKSGGQALTVAEVNDTGAECVWIGEDGDLFRETPPFVVLERVEIEVDDEEHDEHEDDEENDEHEQEDDEDNQRHVA
jgi:uncharacterized protein YodC (DUF2158 family)